MNDSIRAVIWDIGGVLTESPVGRIRNYCAANAIPDEARWAIFGPEDGPWSRFERSEFDPPQFALEFERVAKEHGVETSGRAFLEWFFQGFPPRMEMLAVVEALRPHYKMGVITNNVARHEQGPRRTSGIDIHNLFETVVESAIVGARKPEPKIFQICCEKLGVEPGESVFLDDLGANLKGARALGMHTIKVDETLSAIGELEEVLGRELPYSPRRAASE